MAGKTHGDKIDELIRATAILTERVRQLDEDLRAFDAERSKIAENLVTLQAKTASEFAALTTRIALLEQQHTHLKTTWEEGGRRWWMVVGPLVGALVGSAATGLVNYLLLRR